MILTSVLYDLARVRYNVFTLYMLQIELPIFPHDTASIIYIMNIVIDISW